MTRDPELIRQLLLIFKKKPTRAHIKPVVIPPWDDQTIEYHLVLLYEAGFLRCEPTISSTSNRVISVLPFELTWEGQEFISKAENQFIRDDINHHLQNLEDAFPGI